MNTKAYVLAFNLWLQDIIVNEPTAIRVTGLLDLPEEDRTEALDEISLRMASQFDQYFKEAINRLGERYEDTLDSIAASNDPENNQLV